MLISQQPRSGVPSVSTATSSLLTDQRMRQPHTFEAEALDWPSSAAFMDISHLPQVSSGWARCVRVALCDADNNPCYLFEQGDTLRLFYEFELLHDIDVPVGGMSLENKQGLVVHGKNSLQYTTAMPPHADAGTHLRYRHDITLDIAVGEYTIEVGLASTDAVAYEQRAFLTPPDLYDKTTRICHLNTIGPISVTYRHDAIPTQLAFWGMVNLPGDHAFQQVGGNEGASE